MNYLTGLHAIEERIRLYVQTGDEGGRECGPLLMAKAGPRAREIADLATASKIRIDRIGSFELDRIAPGNRGIALQVNEAGRGKADTSLEEFLCSIGERSDSLVIILDEITDPHNYGAILRSCDQFAVDLVISRNRRSAKHADVISKTSAGTAAWVPQAETANLVRSAKLLKESGFWIYGADMNGQDVFSVKLSGRIALVLGSEGTGISRLLLDTCDGTVAIPSLGKVDSLNVSVAAGVLLYEVQRQRLAG